MALLFWSLYWASLTITVSAATTPYNIQAVENNGIMFEDIGKILLFHDTWNLFTQVNISDLYAETMLVEHTGFLISRLCEKHKNETNACTEQTLQIHGLIESIKKRTSTIREITSGQRQRRSIFDGVGKGLHYLFGTMDSENEKEIYSRISGLESDTKALLDLEKNQITLFKSTFEKLRKPMQTLESNQREITKTVNDLLDLVTGEISTRQRIQEVITTLSLQILDIDLRQQTFIEIITSLRSNQIHPLLLSPSTLLETYHKANPKESSQQVDYDILTQMLEIKSQAMNDLLVIRITFPILNLPEFKLQQIHLFPIKTPSNHSLILDVGYAFIASHISTQEFVLFKQTEFKVYKKLSNSFHQNTYIGPLLSPITQGETVKECVINFIFNPFNEPNNCEYLAQVHSPKLLIKLTRKNSWLFSFPTRQKINIVCKQVIHSSTLFENGVLSLNEPCHFQIGDQVIYFEDEDHHDIKISQPEYVYPQTYNLSNTIQNLLNTLGNVTSPKQLVLVRGESAHQILNENSYKLEELEKQLRDVEKQRRERNTTQAYQISSISFSSTAILLLAIIGICKLTNIVRKRRSQIPTTTLKNTKTTQVEMQKSNSQTESTLDTIQVDKKLSVPNTDPVKKENTQSQLPESRERPSFAGSSNEIKIQLERLRPPPPPNPPSEAAKVSNIQPQKVNTPLRNLQIIKFP